MRQQYRPGTCKAASRFYIPTRGRSKEALEVAAQFSINYARMELDGQPSNGWTVNLELKHCPCRYHAKMRDCVHLQFALQLHNYVGGDGERVMANRSKKTSSRRLGQTSTRRWS
ncbi:hypothetical protein F441_07580 [Phytophthora nicotianae CJ01A1]|uniref:SWIM-type domain-containing protein n=2 Tax=Phytophthora nicotianae TaxID=4792 RepID=W2GZI3_PHYNI|nr:hypothetical protein L915_07429 [Phytophthora nicotianae]ETL41706.1 hypothetical protein L916_07372 [Phytophthora nicotianae]ETP18151.1 hypothetical protein F441_07580 [Phytophthora nicotianae CJ01A1]